MKNNIMKNEYLMDSDKITIFIKSKKYGNLETFISSDKLYIKNARKNLMPYSQ